MLHIPAAAAAAAAVVVVVLGKQWAALGSRSLNSSRHQCFQLVRLAFSFISVGTYMKFESHKSLWVKRRNILSLTNSACVHWNSYQMSHWTFKCGPHIPRCIFCPYFIRNDQCLRYVLQITQINQQPSKPEPVQLDQKYYRTGLGLEWLCSRCSFVIWSAWDTRPA